MRVVIAPDKFKGSLTALQAAAAMARGVARAAPEASIDQVPMADGGEGTTQALVAATGGSIREAQVTGPLGEPVVACFGLLGDGRTAVIEMAAASGLVLVPGREAQPLDHDHAGHRRAAAGGDRRRSASASSSASAAARPTTAGPAWARPSAFACSTTTAATSNPAAAIWAAWPASIASGRRRELDGVEVAVACDVTNPLCGPQGASAVYGPQKGATPRDGRSTRPQPGPFRGDRRARPGRGDQGPARLGRRRRAGRGPGRLRRRQARARHQARHRCGQAGRAARERRPLLDRRRGHRRPERLRQDGRRRRPARSIASAVPTLALAGSIGPGAEAVLEQGIDAYFSICPGPSAWTRRSTRPRRCSNRRPSRRSRVSGGPARRMS